MTVAFDALAAGPQESGGEWVDPALHDTLARRGGIGFRLTPGQDAAAGVAAEPEPIRLHVRDYQQAAVCKKLRYGDAEPPMIDVTTCGVCDATMLPVSGLVDRRDVRYLTLGLCPRCGFMQHIRRPPADFYTQFYAETWDPRSRGVAVTTDMVPADMSLVSVVQRHCPAGARVLEIGAGYGGTMRGFVDSGYAIVGIEPSRQRAEVAKEVLGLDCHCLLAEHVVIGEPPFIPDSFDVFVTSHTLEHVFNPRQVLEHLYPLLKDDGIALVCLPNFYCEHPTTLTHDITHVCSFAVGNLLYLLRTIGFELIQDYSTSSDLIVVVRKGAPSDEAQRRTELEALCRVQPHRALAHVLERVGLSCVPPEWNRDTSVRGRWVAATWPGGPEETQVYFDYLMLSDDVPALDKLRAGVRRRTNVADLAALLPIQYVYQTDGASLWYY